MNEGEKPMQQMTYLAAAVATLLMASGAASAQTSDCAAFAATALPGMTLKTEAVAGDSTRPPGATAGPLLVAHCKVNGKMA